jgi:hypothetical protein
MSNRRSHFNKAVEDSLRAVQEADQGVVYSDNGPTVAFSSSTPVDEETRNKGATERRLDSKSLSAVRNFTKKYNKRHR